MMKLVIIRIWLAAAFAAVVASSALAEQSWTFANNLLTGSDGMVLTAKLSGTEVTITGVSNSGTLTTLDLRGTVTGPNDESCTIVAASGIGFSGLKELYLPDTLRTLSGVAGCATLEKVEPFLPASLTSVPSFRQCSKLTGGLKLANPSMTSISDQCFRETAITSVDFTGSAIASIGNSAFVSCKSLKTVTPFLPDTVRSIGEYAFSGCSILEGDLLFNNAQLKSTGKNSFASTKITSVDFGISPVETIAGSFNSCTSLTNITPFLPSTVKSIGTDQYPFGNSNSGKACPVAKVLHLNSPDLKSIPWGAFLNMPITGLDFTGCGVETIGAYAFGNLSNVKQIDNFLPASVYSLGEGAFSNTPVTNELTMVSKTPGTIAKAAFSGAKPIRVDLRESAITSIGENAFYKCGSKKVVLPACLTSLGAGALNQCTAEEGFWFCGPKPAIGGSLAFYTGMGNCTGAYFFPKGDKTWEDYIYDSSQNTVTALTAAEKENFKTLFPSVSRIPGKKVKMQNVSYASAQYLCWWRLKPVGMTVIIR